LVRKERLFMKVQAVEALIETLALARAGKVEARAT